MARSIQTSIRLQPDEMARLEEEAERQAVPVSFVIRQAIKRYFEQLEPTAASVDAPRAPVDGEIPPEVVRQIYRELIETNRQHVSAQDKILEVLNEIRSEAHANRTLAQDPTVDLAANSGERVKGDILDKF